MDMQTPLAAALGTGRLCAVAELVRPSCKFGSPGFEMNRYGLRGEYAW
jgi:hypothetical protein